MREPTLHTSTRHSRERSAEPHTHTHTTQSLETDELVSAARLRNTYFCESSLLNKPTARRRHCAQTHILRVAPGPCAQGSEVHPHRVSSLHTTQVSRPWAPAADILHFAVKTFAWLAYACCGFAWR